ncbi:MAG: cysteine desulfurase [Rhodospirillales bacterium]|nr:MAG: cysteine desulfurase [Rhodospirillales bacterium]
MTGASFCYLDHNATTPLRPQAARAMARAFAQLGNPSSVHSCGRAARRIVEDARRRVAALVAVSPDSVVFTSGGTEANNLALCGAGRRRILASAIEHPSVLDAAAEVETIPVHDSGQVDLDALQAILGDGRDAIVSVMLANNETGVIQPVSRAAELAHQVGALFHCDCVQGVGRVPLDFAGLRADLLTLSAHKMGGPTGVGALIVAEDVALSPAIRGGGQERGRRSGTENLPGIAGFAAAAEAAATTLETVENLAALRDRMESEVLQRISGARVVGANVPRLANTSCIALPGVAAETQVMAMDLAGFAVSAGAACSSGKVRASHVLQAMGLQDDIAGCAIRISLGAGNDASEIERFVVAYSDFAARTGVSAA